MSNKKGTAPVAKTATVPVRCEPGQSLVEALRAAWHKAHGTN